MKRTNYLWIAAGGLALWALLNRSAQLTPPAQNGSGMPIVAKQGKYEWIGPAGDALRKVVEAVTGTASPPQGGTLNGMDGLGACGACSQQPMHKWGP